jgi:hypothetical protein
VDVVGKGLRRCIHCAQLIDATGDADVVGMTGYPRRRAEDRQPGTLIFRLGGYDVDSLDAGEVEARYRAALDTGKLLPGDVANVKAPLVAFLRSGGENAQHVLGADSATAATQTSANIAGRQSVLRLLRFIRSLPGCENARLLWMAPETAVRETSRIVGEVTVTVEDYVAGRAFDDAVCYAFYPVDLHTEAGVQPEPLGHGVVPTIPLRALIPGGSYNLLVAGRSVSSDRLANSALRVQAPCMAMGQAAGAAAALAAAGAMTPGSVDLAALKALLRQNGAIVP